jgi:hypothetical protein
LFFKFVDEHQERRKSFARSRRRGDKGVFAPGYGGPRFFLDGGGFAEGRFKPALGKGVEYIQNIIHGLIICFTFDGF